MLEYTCSKCHYPVSLNDSRCPHCGVILNGVRCSSCFHIDTETAFRNNGNRCPKCNNYNSFISGSYSSSYGSSSYLSTPSPKKVNDTIKEPSIPPTLGELIGAFFLGILGLGLGTGGIYMIYSYIKQNGLDLLAIVLGCIIGSVSLFSLFGSIFLLAFIPSGIKDLRELKQKVKGND